MAGSASIASISARVATRQAKNDRRESHNDVVRPAGSVTYAKNEGDDDRKSGTKSGTVTLFPVQPPGWSPLLKSKSETVSSGKRAGRKPGTVTSGKHAGGSPRFATVPASDCFPANAALWSRSLPSVGNSPSNHRDSPGRGRASRKNGEEIAATGVSETTLSSSGFA